jgi:hypothetical protein
MTFRAAKAIMLAMLYSCGNVSDIDATVSFIDAAQRTRSAS